VEQATKERDKMSHNEVIAEAMTAVVSAVPEHLRESVAEVLTKIATAQYSAGYRDALINATDMVKEVVSA